MNVIIKEITTIEPYLNELSTLLIDVVDDGASVGFLPPLQENEATEYWTTVQNSTALLFLAFIENEVVGTVQLQLETKENGKHRAEIAKLMTHPRFRRRGVGRLLMEAAERRARSEKRTLLVLDTRKGDPSNDLYTALAFKKVGEIPEYCLTADGHYEATVYYYKLINDK
ncbi:GNAT family N-acetyltransferase [Alkalihalobacillus sp. LMS39]|uniref:GNAT family N-acetyltransferase n=1 Tax=Alkalihalobacillus sp. LMS39 TaxID=2924032 RepID=UPI001FB3D35B|nr:GNAT family N-acetyltransferase [Alkalihalobacillus sp. LMS39]UOE96154.1 GNAT family N-acetyltransferase [Alkalihalobacillus sp. LMS39]